MERECKEFFKDKLLILDRGKVIDYGRKEVLFHKYCGRAVIVVEHSDKNEAILAGYDRLASPARLIALSCTSQEKEREITEVLLKHNVNYKRSSDDIEILYTNAKQEGMRPC